MQFNLLLYSSHCTMFTIFSSYCGFGILYLQTCFLFQTSANINCCRHLVSSESSNIPKKYPLSLSYQKSNSPSPGGLFCANADVVVVISACGCGLHHISENSELAGNSNFGLSNLCATGDHHHHQKLWEDQQYQIEESHQQENHRQ